MTLENQLTNLELSKKLKELGVKQESLFYWYPKPKVLPNSGGTVVSDGYKILLGKEARTYGSKAMYSAFSVAELGEMLPKKLCSYDNAGTKKYPYRVQYQLFRYPMQKASTEADARAKMLIYLIENNLIKP